ncbi:uncharacterized protein PRCAT00002047001 [Priceomyces carsonii]|uniref:uncharacterized protein n=1 Tax=Priceomyces carsonii TaxID=28549 RepID=UPI002ED9527A|nr:unnamed protein product [Priceomyces carsonii]
MAQRQLIKELKKDYSSTFNQEELGKDVDGMETVHRITSKPGLEPPVRPPYCLGAKEQDELQIQLQNLIAVNLIQPSQSPYSAPICYVKKKDGSLRMCVDYRALNAQTIKDKFPLPHIEDLLDEVGH